MRVRQSGRFLSCAGVALLASCVASDSGTASGEHLASIEFANAQFDSAYRRGDTPAIGAMMTDSAIVSAEGLADLNGRAAIERLLSEFFATTSVEAFTLHAVEVSVVGDRSFERGTFLWQSGPRGGAMTSRTGRYALQRVRTSDGAWRIHRYLENSLPSATSASTVP